MKILDKIYAYGHQNVLGTHKTTIEITKNLNVTVKGDCIVAVNATKACSDLNLDLKEKIKNGGKFIIIFEVDDVKDSFEGFGNIKLSLSDMEDMVFRKSNFICERTVLINCTKAARDINRDLIEKLRMPEKKLSITFQVTEINGNE